MYLYTKDPTKEMDVDVPSNLHKSMAVSANSWTVAEIPHELRQAAKKAKRVYQNEKGFWEADYGDDIIMVYIPPGKFTMGSNDYDDEKPPHIVYLDGYWMGKYEVTVKQYLQFVKDKKSHFPEWLEKGSKYSIETGNDDYYKKFVSDENYPAVGISWDDAGAYCDWLSNKMGLNFSLPTEAQWEKAARGIDGRKYPWGNKEPDGNLANFDRKVLKVTPVGSYPGGSSLYGILDMAGNVWEWCYDWYDERYYDNMPGINPTGPTSGSLCVVRGGSWGNQAINVRCAVRGGGRPSNRGYDAGFRLCMEVSEHDL
jgi:sulfatase modifying factor 1